MSRAAVRDIEELKKVINYLCSTTVVNKSRHMGLHQSSKQPLLLTVCTSVHCKL